jgi:hypothetical protein
MGLLFLYQYTGSCVPTVIIVAEVMSVSRRVYPAQFPVDISKCFILLANKSKEHDGHSCKALYF